MLPRTTSMQNILEMANEAAKLEIDSDNFQIETKKSIWLRMGNELEAGNYPKTDIYTEIHGLIQERLQEFKKDINYIFNNGYLHYICSQQGWTKSSEQKMDNSSLSVPDLEGECVKERTEFIKFNNDIREEASANIEILKRSEYLDDHDNMIKIEWSKMFDDDSFHLLGNLFYADRDEWRRQRDSRQSLLPKMRFLITALSSVMTNKFFCSTYFAIVKAIEDITPKKLTGYFKDVQVWSDLFENCQVDSWLFNFLPMECPDCKKLSLKTKILLDGTWKIVCYNWSYHKQGEKYYDPKIIQERLDQLSQNKGGSAINYIKKFNIKLPDN